VHLTLEGGDELVAVVAADAAPRIDEQVAVRVPPEAIHLFDPASGARVAGSVPRA
jgi:hypothetical protein